MDRHYAVVEKSVELYNQNKLDEYFKLFDQNINIFNTNGLGTARVASGLEDYKRFIYSMQRNNTVEQTLFEHFTSGDWVFARQRSRVNKMTIEASIGYRIQNDKIVDIMIVGEKTVQ